MDTLSRWVTRYRWIVGAVWLAITVVGVLAAPSLSSRLHPGAHFNSAAYTATQQIASHYGGATENPGVLTLNLPPGQTVRSAGVRAELAAVDTGLAKAAPAVRVVSYASTGSTALLGTGGTSTIVLAYPPHAGAPMDASAIGALTRAAQAAAPALTVHGTSLNALASGSASKHSTTVLGTVVLGAAAALIVLAWVFGSFLALLPLIMALISVLTMQLLVYGLTYLMPSSSPLNPAVQFIVALLGLGLSIDYSLLVVTRWREERAAGRPNEEAVRVAMKRAGHSVWFSGLVASLGLFALIVIPNSVVRGIGITGLFIPSTATLVALTLLPAVLSTVGPRMDWPRRRGSGQASRLWTWWAHRVIRHRVAAAVTGVAILGALAGTAATINIAQPTSSALASSGPATNGLRVLKADGFPGGVLTTVPVYVPHATAAASIAASLDKVSSLRGAAAPAGAAWRQGGSALVIALPRNEVGSSAGGTSLADIRGTVPRGALVGGTAALSVDQAATTYAAFPLLFGVVALVTFVLLLAGLKSVLLAAKAVLLNALSVTAAYGILVLIFQHGLGTQALWGIRSYGAIDALAPVLIFGFLFGVSMDYEVFILSRVREGYDRTGSTREGIIEGVSRTGRLVTSAALILFCALASLSTVSTPVVRQIAAGMAAGVILDALVVRMLLLPALVSLFGRANWWLPGPARKLLRLPEAGPGQPAPGPPAPRHPAPGDALLPAGTGGQREHR